MKTFPDKRNKFITVSCTMKSAKGVLQADGNLNLQEGMKNIRNVLKYFYDRMMEK